MKAKKSNVIRFHRRKKDQSVADTYVRNGIIRVIAILGIVTFLILAGRLFYVMVIRHNYYESKAISGQTRSTTVGASRGNIYDRNMNLLAASSSTQDVYLNNKELQTQVDNGELTREEFLSNVARILNLDLNTLFSRSEDLEQYYKCLAKSVNLDTIDELKAYVKSVKGQCMHYEDSEHRYYPYSSLAAQTIGYVNNDGLGQTGLEGKYNEILNGREGKIVTSKGKGNTTMLYSYSKTYEAKNGYTLITTIDSTIEYYLEKEMEAAVERYDVLNGAFGMVYNCKTGEIMGMATLGSYDPNNYLTIFDETEETRLEEMFQAALEFPENSQERKDAIDEYNKAVATARINQWNNRCVSGAYEPGSTFKILTMAAALDSGKVTLDDTWSCSGAEEIVGRDQTLNCWQHSGHGYETTAQALQKSCNIAFAKISIRMGGQTMYDYCEAFGLTERTGIDLPSEASGIFHSSQVLANTQYYGTSYLTSTSFGQTVKITPVQLCRAVGAVVNGGYLLEPYVVSEVIDEDNNVVEKNTRTVVRQVISEETSATMRDMIESVVTKGTAKNAAVIGYSIGGKTGTAEKTDVMTENGTYTDDKIVSFIGIAPMEDPTYIVLVALDTPNSHIGNYVSGGVMAAPTVAAIYEDILPYLGVEPHFSEEEMDRALMHMPNVIGKTVEEAEKLLKENYLEYKVVGTGDTIVSCIPAIGKPVPGNSTVTIYLDESMTVEQVEVPDLTGKTLGQARRALNKIGLYLQVKGTYNDVYFVKAAYQSVEAGTMVSKGTTIAVTFADTTDLD